MDLNAKSSELASKQHNKTMTHKSTQELSVQEGSKNMDFASNTGQFGPLL